MSRNYERKKRIPRVSDGSQIITIHIPAEGSVMTMHAHLAVHFSDYFLAALNSPMEEARTLSFSLEKPATAYTARCFVEWAYARASRATLGRYLRDSLGINTVEKVVDAWLLADYLRVPRYMNLLALLLLKLLREDADLLRDFEIEPLLARLPEGSGLWRLLIALLAKRVSDPLAWSGNGASAAAAAAGGNGLASDFALGEFNRALAAQLAAARSCVTKLGNCVVRLPPGMSREMDWVLENGVLGLNPYLEGDGSR